jgi:hypothetical protein
VFPFDDEHFTDQDANEPDHHPGYQSRGAYRDAFGDKTVSRREHEPAAAFAIETQNKLNLRTNRNGSAPSPVATAVSVAAISTVQKVASNIALGRAFVMLHLALHLAYLILQLPARA